MANDFMLAYREDLKVGAVSPQPPDLGAPGKLELTVLFTGLAGTLSALRKATELASGLNARIRLLVPQLVPYPLPLESPPVLLEFNKQRFQAIAAKQSLETRVDIFLCRDVDVLLRKILAHGSTVLIGGRKRWWPTSEARMARRLHRWGYETVFTGELLQEEEHKHA